MIYRLQNRLGFNCYASRRHKAPLCIAERSQDKTNDRTSFHLLPSYFALKISRVKTIYETFVRAATQRLNIHRDMTTLFVLILTLVSASVAFNSNSVIIFRTPSCTRIPWFSRTGRELSTGRTVITNSCITWNIKWRVTDKCRTADNSDWMHRVGWKCPNHRELRGGQILYCKVWIRLMKCTEIDSFCRFHASRWFTECVWPPHIFSATNQIWYINIMGWNDIKS